jgi:hypothetical protein
VFVTGRQAIWLVAEPRLDDITAAGQRRVHTGFAAGRYGGL